MINEPCPYFKYKLTHFMKILEIFKFQNFWRDSDKILIFVKIINIIG